MLAVFIIVLAKCEHLLPWPYLNVTGYITRHQPSYTVLIIFVCRLFQMRSR